MHTSETLFFVDAYYENLQSLQRNEFGSQPLLTPPQYLFLLRCLQLNVLDPKEQEHLRAVFTSLTNSDIHDPIEGGFFYTINKKKSISESHRKTLYQNALMIAVFTEFSGFFHEGLFAAPAINAAVWIINNLLSENNLFYLEMNSENAQQDYYAIDIGTLNNYLDPDSCTAFMSAFGITKQDLPCSSKLKQVKTWQQIAKHTSLHIKQVPLALENARQLLLIARTHRQPPDIIKTISIKDNCKVIITLLKAAHQFNRDDFATAAVNALDSLLLEFPIRQINGISNYLIVIHTLIVRLQHQWCEQLFQILKQLAEQFLNTIQPSSNNIVQTMVNEQIDYCFDDFNILLHLTRNNHFQVLALSISNKIHRIVNEQTDTHFNLLIVRMKSLSTQHVIVIRGKTYEVNHWLQQLVTGFKPLNHVYAIPNNYQSPDPEHYPDTAKVQAYIHPFSSDPMCSRENSGVTVTSLRNLLENYS